MHDACVEEIRPRAETCFSSMEMYLRTGTVPVRRDTLHDTFCPGRKEHFSGNPRDIIRIINKIPRPFVGYYGSLTLESFFFFFQRDYDGFSVSACLFVFLYYWDYSIGNDLNGLVNSVLPAAGFKGQSWHQSRLRRQRSS
jgi:hypothetical protein